MYRQIRVLTLKQINFALTNVNNCESVCSLRVLSNFRNDFLPNLKVSCRNVQFSAKSNAKIFQDYENNYAYGILRELPVMDKFDGVSTVGNRIDTAEQFDAILEQNWRASSATKILHAFESVSDYCVTNDIDLSDTRFDKLVDGLLDNVEKLSVDEIAAMLRCLAKFPQTESFKSHNFHDAWSALDDVCCWRMPDWSVEQMFHFAHLWYKLNLGIRFLVSFTLF